MGRIENRMNSWVRHGIVNGDVSTRAFYNHAVVAPTSFF